MNEEQTNSDKFAIRYYDQQTGELRTMLIDRNELWTGYVPLDCIMPDPDQPRVYFDMEKLKEIVPSFKHTRKSRVPQHLRHLVANQRQPMKVVPHIEEDNPAVCLMLVDGERRWHAIRDAGFPAGWVNYIPGVDDENKFEDSLVSNLCREGHTYGELVNGVGRLLEDNGVIEVAQLLGRSEAWVYTMERLLKLEPSLLVCMDPPTPKKDRLPLNAALQLAKLNQADQVQRWKSLKERGVDKRSMSEVISLEDGLGYGNGPDGGRNRRLSDDRKTVTTKVRRVSLDLDVLDGLHRDSLACFTDYDVDPELEIVRASLKKLQRIALRLAQIGKKSALTQRVIEQLGQTLRSAP